MRASNSLYKNNFFEMLILWLLWSINLKFPSVLKCHDLFVKMIWRRWAHQTLSSIPHVHITPIWLPFFITLLQSMIWNLSTGCSQQRRCKNETACPAQNFSRWTVRIWGIPQLEHFHCPYLQLTTSLVLLLESSNSSQPSIFSFGQL